MSSDHVNLITVSKTLPLTSWFVTGMLPIINWWALFQQHSVNLFRMAQLLAYNNCESILHRLHYMGLI